MSVAKLELDSGATSKAEDAAKAAAQSAAQAADAAKAADEFETGGGRGERRETGGVARRAERRRGEQGGGRGESGRAERRAGG